MDLTFLSVWLPEEEKMRRSNGRVFISRREAKEGIIREKAKLT